MAEQQSEQPVVFIRRLLTRLLREFENCNGLSDHIDSVLYRIDWLYNYNSVSDELVGIVRDAITNNADKLITDGVVIIKGSAAEFSSRVRSS